MSHTGVQHKYNNVKDSESKKRDVNDMIEDLVRQNRHLDRWETGGRSGK